MVNHEIVEFRKCHDITRAELAGRLGVSVPTIWRWEKGKVKPHRVLYKKLKEIMQRYDSLRGK